MIKMQSPDNGFYANPHALPDCILLYLARTSTMN